MSDNISPELMKNKKAAHVIGLKINDEIDARSIPPGQRSKFATEYHNREVTDLTIAIAEDDYDSTERADKLKFLAEIDRRSGLHRAEGYPVALQNALAQFYSNPEKSCFNLAQIDIDFFGWMNDVLRSHNLGNLVINAIGSIIEENLRMSEGDIAFRVGGGEEFAIIFGRDIDVETAKQVSIRVHQSIRRNLLDRAINIAMYGERMSGVVVGDIEKKERAGTIALKQYASEVLKMRAELKEIKNIDDIERREVIESLSDRLQYLITTAKGTPEMKKALLSRIMSIDLDGYEAYLQEETVWSEMNAEAVLNRSNFEKKLGKDIKTIFGRLSCSMGLLSLTPEDRHDPLSDIEVDDTVDGLQYYAKEHGRDCIALRVGRDPGNIQYFK